MYVQRHQKPHVYARATVSAPGEVIPAVCGDKWKETIQLILHVHEIRQKVNTVFVDNCDEIG